MFSVTACASVNIDQKSQYILSQYCLKLNDFPNRDICLVSNFTLSCDKFRYFRAPKTLYDTGCSVMSGIILNSNFARRNNLPIFPRPLGQVSYKVRAADKSVMSIAGYVHTLYLKLDNKEFLFSDIPVFDTLSFEAIIGLAARSKYALDFDNKPDGSYFLFENKSLGQRQVENRVKQHTVPSSKFAALTPKLVLSPRGGEGAAPPWTAGCQAPTLTPPLPVGNTNTCQDLGAEFTKQKVEKKVQIENLNNSAPVICTFFPDFLRDHHVNKKTESPSIVKGDHHPDIVTLGLHKNTELVPMHAVEPKNSTCGRGAKIERQNSNFNEDKDPAIVFNIHDSNMDAPNGYEEVIIEDCFEIETSTDTSGEVLVSLTDQNSVPSPNITLMDPSNVETLQKADSEILKNAKFENVKKVDAEIFKNANAEILQNADFENVKKADAEIFENANAEILKNADFEVSKKVDFDILNDNETASPNRYEIVTIEDCIEDETPSDTSEGVLNSNTNPNSVPSPDINLVNPSPVNDVELKHSNTSFIFHVDSNSFVQKEGVEIRASPMPEGAEKIEVAKTEQEAKICQCDSVECKCTCRKCDGPPHYEYASRELPKGIKHRVRLRRPAFVMYLSGVSEGGEGKFTVPPMELNKSTAHYITLNVDHNRDGPDCALSKYPHFHIPEHQISDKVIIPNQIVTRSNKDKVRINISNLNDHSVTTEAMPAIGQFVKATFSPRIVLPNSERKKMKMLKTKTVAEGKAASKDALRKLNQVKRIISEQSNCVNGENVNTVEFEANNLNPKQSDIFSDPKLFKQTKDSIFQALALDEARIFESPSIIIT